MRDGRGVLAAAFGAMALALAAGPVAAESMSAALASAYTDNPDLNSARAQLRAIDEGVPKALSGYRPQVSLSADLATRTTRTNPSDDFRPPGFRSNWSTGSMPRGVQLSVEQPIFLGFRTTNSVKLAQSSVKAAREQLKGVESDVLLDAVTAFMDVIRAQVVVNLTAQNIEFLREQLRAAEDRLNVGEGTRTDVAQTNARLQEGISDYAQAVADLNQAIATYIQVIGHRPESLGGYNGIEKLLPRTMDAGLAVALSEHPSIVAALYNIDIASYNVRIAEGATLPTLGVQGSLTHREDEGGSGSWNEEAQIIGQLTVPIYQGGEAAANVRQFKETLGQRRIDLELGASPGPPGLRLRLGTARRGARPGHGGRSAGLGAAARTHRRHRGTASRAADDPRRSQFAAGPARRAGYAGQRAVWAGGWGLYACSRPTASSTRGPSASRLTCTTRRNTSTRSATSGVGSGRPTDASGPIPTFAPDCRERRANVGNQRTTRNYKVLAAFMNDI